MRGGPGGAQPVDGRELTCNLNGRNMGGGVRRAKRERVSVCI